MRRCCLGRAGAEGGENGSLEGVRVGSGWGRGEEHRGGVGGGQGRRRGRSGTAASQGSRVAGELGQVTCQKPSRGSVQEK